MLFSDENTIIIASARPFQINALVYSHGLPIGQMWCHVKRYHSYFYIRLVWGRKDVPMGCIKGGQPSTRFPDLLLYEISVK